MYDTAEYIMMSLAGLLLAAGIAMIGYVLAIYMIDRHDFMDGCRDVKPDYQCAYMWSKGDHYDIHILFVQIVLRG